MTRRLSATFAVLIIMSLGLVAWLGTRVALDQREILRHRFRALLSAALEDLRGQVDQQVGQARSRLSSALEDLPEGPEGIRARERRAPLVLSFFVLDAECRRLHPPPRPPWTKAERKFLMRSDPLWLAMERRCRRSSGARQAGTEEPQGWQSWTWKDMRLAYWRRQPDGRWTGAEVNTMRLWADILGGLPESNTRDGLIRLDGPMGKTWLQWGAYRPPGAEEAVVSLALRPPLEAWHLSYHASPQALKAATGEGMAFGLSSALVMAGLLLLSLAIMFYRGNLRRLKEASQRVSFVNRVSHELRTPLTNIRMYTELLAEGLPEADEKTKKRLNIILDETGRLGRLINNVLAFSRQQERREELRAEARIPDEVIRAAMAQAEPALERKGISVALAGGAGQRVMLDPDALEQIMANLLSNIEKYAGQGASAEIRSRQEGETCVIQVSDSGPGIPVRMRERIFEPFERASERLTERATGTGLGLAISRDLARLHGGDLKLLPGKDGALFELRLRTPALPKAAEFEHNGDGAIKSKGKTEANSGDGAATNGDGGNVA